MVVKKRQILWDWTNSSGPENPGIPEKINQVPFGDNSPVASVINWNAWVPPELNGRVPFRPSTFFRPFAPLAPFDFAYKFVPLSWPTMTESL